MSVLSFHPLRLYEMTSGASNVNLFTLLGSPSAPVNILA